MSALCQKRTLVRFGIYEPQGFVRHHLARTDQDLAGPGFIAEPRSNIHKAPLGHSREIIASLFLIKCKLARPHRFSFVVCACGYDSFVDCVGGYECTDLMRYLLAR
jgi:hypothetical protein